MKHEQWRNQKLANEGTRTHERHRHKKKRCGSQPDRLLTTFTVDLQEVRIIDGKNVFYVFLF